MSPTHVDDSSVFIITQNLANRLYFNMIFPQGTPYRVGISWRSCLRLYNKCRGYSYKSSPTFNKEPYFFANSICICCFNMDTSSLRPDTSAFSILFSVTNLASTSDVFLSVDALCLPSCPTLKDTPIFIML